LYSRLTNNLKTKINAVKQETYRHYLSQLSTTDYTIWKLAKKGKKPTKNKPSYTNTDRRLGSVRSWAGRTICSAFQRGVRAPLRQSWSSNWNLPRFSSTNVRANQELHIYWSPTTDTEIKYKESPRLRTNKW
jgi:hypothetical protein